MGLEKNTVDQLYWACRKDSCWINPVLGSESSELAQASSLETRILCLCVKTLIVKSQYKLLSYSRTTWPSTQNKQKYLLHMQLLWPTANESLKRIGLFKSLTPSFHSFSHCLLVPRQCKSYRQFISIASAAAAASPSTQQQILIVAAWYSAFMFYGQTSFFSTAPFAFHLSSSSLLAFGMTVQLRKVVLSMQSSLRHALSEVSSA